MSRVAFSCRLPADLVAMLDERAAAVGGSRQATVETLLRGALADADAIEVAVESVVAHLAELGRDDLAAAVAIATDPTPPEKRAEPIATIHRWWTRRPSCRCCGEPPDRGGLCEDCADSGCVPAEERCRVVVASYDC